MNRQVGTIVQKKCGERMKRCACLRIAGWLICGLFLSGSAPAQTITASFTAQDSRLGKAVTSVHNRIFIGELLESWEKQTGVHVYASDDDRAAGEPVTICVEAVPLSEAMNALWSLGSHSAGRLRWIRETPTKTGDPFAYRLSRPREAQNLSATLRRTIDSEFVRNAEEAIKRGHLSREELATLTDKGDPAAAQEMEFESKRAGARLFGSLFDERQRTSFLMGDTVTELPVVKMSTEQKAEVKFIYEQMKGWRILPDGTRQRWPPPETVRFEVDRSEAFELPALFIYMGQSGGWSYINGIPQRDKWNQALAKGWNTSSDGDVANLPVRPSAPSDGATPKPNAAPADEDKFLAFFRTRRIPVLAHLPHDFAFAPRDMDGAALPAVLKSLREARKNPLLFKRHRRFLLTAYPRWFSDDTEILRIPLGTLRRLRAARQADKRNIVPLATLKAEMASCSKSEVQRLAIEFPELENVIAYLPLFRWMKANAASASSDFIPLSKTGREILRNVLIVVGNDDLAGKVGRGAVTAIRFESSESYTNEQGEAYSAEAGGRTPLRSVDLALKDSSGQTENVPIVQIAPAAEQGPRLP